MDDIEKRARDIADVLPAQVDASAWPNGYGDGWNDCARIAHEEILPAIIAALSAAPQVPDGWVVADGQGKRWRKWGDYGPMWTHDRGEALHFVRKSDAEAFAENDEEAWLIQPLEGAKLAVRALSEVTHVYQVRSDPAEGWSDASKERYDAVGQVLELPFKRASARWDRRRVVFLPEGWTIVPLEPTQEMLDVVCTADGFEPWTDKTMSETYRTMLAAKPEPPK